MTIVLETLKSKVDEFGDVDVTCADYGGELRLEQGDDCVVLDDAQLQQLFLVIEREMAKR